MNYLDTKIKMELLEKLVINAGTWLLRTQMKVLAKDPSHRSVYVRRERNNRIFDKNDVMRSNLRIKNRPKSLDENFKLLQKKIVIRDIASLDFVIFGK